MREQITKKQGEILLYVYEFVQKNLYQPSYVEMAEHFKVGKTAIFHRIAAMVKKGVVEGADCSRSLRIKEIGLEYIRKNQKV